MAYNVLEIINRFRASIPVDVEGLADAVGIRVTKPFLDDKTSGMITKLPDGTFEIKVNAKHSEERQRFTVAHEIGHWVLHRTIMGDGNVDDCAYRSDGSIKNNRIGIKQETSANRFAANLLMPTEAIRRIQELEGIRDADAIAKRLKVSPGAVRIRMKSQGFPSEDDFVSKPQTPNQMAYRKKKGHDTWHWCRNCSNWPTSDYDEKQEKPTSGELCNECRGKDNNGTCQK